MKYIRYLNRFWQRYDALNTANPKTAMKGGEVTLYTRLVHEFNAAGLREAWPESLPFRDSDLAGRAGQSVNTMLEARKRLVGEGLITYQSPGPGSRQGGIYALTTSSKIDEVSSANSDEVEAGTSANFDEVTYSKIDEVRGLTYSKIDEVGGLTYSKIDELSIYRANVKKETSILSLETGSVGAKGEEVADEKSLHDPDKKSRGQNPTPLPPAPASNRIDPFLKRGTLKQRAETCNVPFSEWFPTYRFKWNEELLYAPWLALTNDERLEAKVHTPPWVAAYPNTQYRVNPQRYLEEKHFKREIPAQSNEPATDSKTRPNPHRRSAQTFRDAQSRREPSSDFGEL